MIGLQVAPFKFHSERPYVYSLYIPEGNAVRPPGEKNKTLTSHSPCRRHPDGKCGKELRNFHHIKGDSDVRNFKIR